MDHELEDTQQIESPQDLDAEIQRAFARLQTLLPDHPVDPGHRLLAALIAMWPELPTVGERFEAAANLLTLGQRDVWFLTKTDPVEALDDAASRLLVALGDAVTAAGANFYFDTGEPFAPAGQADSAPLSAYPAPETGSALPPAVAPAETAPPPAPRRSTRWVNPDKRRG